MQWNKMSKGQQAAARELRDELNAAGVLDPSQCGPVEVSVSQVAKHLDAAMSWRRGEITLPALCEQAGWTAPAPQVAPEEQPETVTCTLSVIRGECGPDAHGDELGQSQLEGADLGAEVWEWLDGHGVNDSDPDTWVLVTPPHEYTGQLCNLVAQREITVLKADLGAAGREDDAVGWEEAIGASLDQLEDLDR